MHRKWLPAALLVTLCVDGQNLQEIEKKVTEFTLPNGLHFILYERHQAPVVSMVTYVNVGSANDPAGKTGLAHMLEHMAFKGTPTLGTKNWPEEQKLLSTIEEIYDRLEAERNKGPRADPEKMKKIEAELKATIEKANSYVDQNAYSRVIESNGGPDMNAQTSLDATSYFYSLPSNRLELWFLLTSQVFRQPIMREFYKERDVVREERRMNFESRIQGRMQDLFLTTAFLAHPQRTMIGWGSDIENLRAKDSLALFRTYYVPSNMAVVIAGDVHPADAKRLANQYFAGMPSGPTPPIVTTEEPKQEGERRTSVAMEVQPQVLIGYKRPDPNHSDDPALTVFAGALSGRTGVLYKELVEEKKIALAAVAGANFTGSKYPGLFVFLGVPAVGKTVDENEKAIYDIIDRYKKQKFEDKVLNRVKTQIRAGLIRQLDSNMGMAMQLASYYMQTGDWRRLFKEIDDIQKVTADDVERVVKTYFDESARTVVLARTAQQKEAAK